MKIIYLHQYFNLPSDGGSSRSYEMALRLASFGHEVHVVTSDRKAGNGSHSWSTVSLNGLTVHWLEVPYSNKMSNPRRLAAFLRFAVRASTQARRLHGDVVFASSTPLTIAIPGIVACAFRRAPMVFEVRDLWPRVPIAMGALPNPLLRILAVALERLAYKSSEHIVALSPTMREGVIETGYPPERISVIPNAADLALFEGRDDEGELWRESFPWLKRRKMVLYCGTLGRVNDVRYLVEVAAEVARIDSGVRFVVVGDGVEEDLIRARATELEVYQVNFFMLPQIPKVFVPVVFAAADMTISTVAPIVELEANSANKFFDSLAAGRPIAINHGGWQAKLLEETGAGVVLDSTDHVRAAATLVLFLNDRDRLTRAGAAAKAVAVERFARDALAGELAQLLVAAVARRDDARARSCWHRPIGWRGGRLSRTGHRNPSGTV